MPCPPRDHTHLGQDLLLDHGNLLLVLVVHDRLKVAQVVLDRVQARLRSRASVGVDIAEKADPMDTGHDGDDDAVVIT